jgi:hypothetical protein
MMRRGLILLLMVTLATLANAQQMGIEDFSRLKRPFWKRSKVTIDKQKAIIDLYTKEKGFTFTANGKEAAEAKEGEGVITVKVPTKTHHLTIKHPQYGTLTWRVPVKYLKRKKHYRATLIATDSTQRYKLKEQWVQFEVSPKNAILHMDTTIILLRDGQMAKSLPLGKHTYQVEAPFYEELTDSFELADTAKVMLNIALQPTYSYLTVSTQMPKADLRVDGVSINKQEGTSTRLIPGEHRLSLHYKGNCYYDEPFTIGLGEKKHIEVALKDLRLRPAAEQPKKVLALATPAAATDSTATTGATAADPKDMAATLPLDVRGMVNIHSNVIGARISISGQHVGETPCIVQDLSSRRSYVITLEKEGYKTVKTAVRPRGNELTDLNIKMKQK